MRRVWGGEGGWVGLVTAFCAACVGEEGGGGCGWGDDGSEEEDEDSDEGDTDGFGDDDLGADGAG